MQNSRKSQVSTRSDVYPLSEYKGKPLHSPQSLQLQPQRLSMDGFLSRLAPAQSQSIKSEVDEKNDTRSSSRGNILQFQGLRLNQSMDGTMYNGGSRHQESVASPLHFANYSKPLSKQRAAQVELNSDLDFRERAVAAASVAVAAAQAAASIVKQLASYNIDATSAERHDHWDEGRLYTTIGYPKLKVMMKQERAATIIQAVYRGHLARQAFKALKALVKIQACVRGYLVRKQLRISLHCMHALMKLQTRVRARQLQNVAKMMGLDRLDPSFGIDHDLKQNGLLLQVDNAQKQLQKFQNARLAFSRRQHTLEEIRRFPAKHHPKEHSKQRDMKKRPIRAMKTSLRATLIDCQDRMQENKGMNAGDGSYTFSFEENEPDKLHKDWTWLEGWMMAEMSHVHSSRQSRDLYQQHAWESNAAALWERQDELRTNVFYSNAHETLPEHECLESEEEAILTPLALYHAHRLNYNTLNDEDAQSIKIIEMDKVATDLTKSSITQSPLSSNLCYFQQADRHNLPKSKANGDLYTAYSSPRSSLHEKEPLVSTFPFLP